MACTRCVALQRTANAQADKIQDLEQRLGDAPAALREMPAKYLALMAVLHYMATEPSSKGGEKISTGATESKAPSYNARAAAMLRREIRALETRANAATEQLDRLVEPSDTTRPADTSVGL